MAKKKSAKQSKAKTSVKKKGTKKVSPRKAATKKKTAKKTVKKTAAKKTTTNNSIINLDEKKKQAGRIAKGLAKKYPKAECALIHDSPFQLLVSTILSAQCTDERVNSVTPNLYKKYPNLIMVTN